MPDVDDYVQLNELYQGCPSGSIGKVTAVDAGEQALSVNIECKPNNSGGCQTHTRLLSGAPASMFTVLDSHTHT